MLAFISKHGILSTDQYGFQSSKSTNDAIFAFLERLYLRLNEGEVAAAAFCDISKAFDCVNHKILLQKLQTYGFRGIPMLWFESYLAERSQSVTLANENSNQLALKHGVPQGSVLGPLLFLLYVNDLTHVDVKGQFTIFADDTTILWHGKDNKILEDIINDDLSKLKKWCDANLLSLNTTKTGIINFKCVINNIVLENVCLGNKDTNKFLGLNIDAKLKFEGHILGLAKKLASGCYAVRVTSNELGLTAARNVYFSLIESHLRYGICFWGMCANYLFERLFVLQKRALRYMCKAGTRDSCRPLFLSHGILPLACIFILETVCLVQRKYKDFRFVASSHTTRSSSLSIKLPIPTSTLTKNSLIYESKKLFNHLPSHLKIIENEQKFRKSVKEFLKVKSCYNLDEFYQNT